MTPHATKHYSLGVLLLMGAQPVAAQVDDSHTITITVIERQRIQVIGGDVAIDVTPTGPGTTTASDSTTALQWWSNGNHDRHITVETNLPTPAFSLTVEAGDVTEIQGKTKNSTPGTAVGVVPLDGVGARLFIQGIRRTWSMCDLLYTAEADATALPGADVHTVTYTLLRS